MTPEELAAKNAALLARRAELAKEKATEQAAREKEKAAKAERKAAIAEEKLCVIPAASAAPEATPGRKWSKKRYWKHRKGFREFYPKLFEMKGSWKVFDDVWRHSKFTSTGQLRFEGLKKDVSKRTGVCYHQVKKIWKSFEAKGLFKFVLRGRRLSPGAAKKAGKTVIHSIEMLPSCPAQWALIKRKAREKRAMEAAKSLPAGKGAKN